jgi:hypothetical protein
VPTGYLSNQNWRNKREIVLNAKKDEQRMLD